MIAALAISFVRLIYIFLLKENITSEEFTSYVFLISIIAICSSALSPIDSIVSRFSRAKTEKIYLSYCLFHIYLRILIITIVSLGIYALVPLLGGWLVYGLIASLFLKRASSRDYLLLISSGLVGGLIGGSIGNNMDIPQNLWWMREIIKIGVTIVAMYTIQIIRLQIYNFRNNT